MMDLAEVSARLEIREALTRFCRGVDRGDADLICSAYHPDARDRHGAYDGDAAGLATLVIEDMDKAGYVGQHMLSNTLMEIDGDSARVESYWMVVHPEPTGMIWAGGRYLDRFECRSGEWKIAERLVVIDWSRAAEDPPPERWAAHATLPQGMRREADPSAGFFKNLIGA